jgi:hypothetical protein
VVTHFETHLREAHERQEQYVRLMKGPPARDRPRMGPRFSQEDTVMAEPTLYERLGGIFAIAAVIDNFSDRLVKNPKIVNANPELREWHTVTYHTRMPGLK